jgi:hypothetical protein
LRDIKFFNEGPAHGLHDKPVVAQVGTKSINVSELKQYITGITLNSRLFINILPNVKVVFVSLQNDGKW